MATPLKLLKNPSLFLKAALSPNLFSPKVPDCTKHAVSCKKQTPSRKVGKIQPKQLLFCKKHHNVDTPPKNYKTTSKTLWAGPKVVDNIENMNIIQSSDINGSRKEKSESNFLHIIGKGKFGTVVKGVYNEKLVAIKIKKITTKVSRLRASREFNGLGLNHENIVKTLDIIFDHDQALVVMEYNIKSKSLQSELDEQQSIIEIDLNDWDLKVAIDVSKGVCFLHDHGILHLDIKPANIIMCDNGVCKICDFGNSVQINRAAEEINCCGTVAYTDPEILKGNSPSEKSDIYSLGVLFWQIRNKERPYSNHCNGDIVIYKVVKYNLRPSTKLASTSCRSSAFSSIYKMCWSADPKLRPTAEQVLVLLRMVEKQGRIV